MSDDVEAFRRKISRRAIEMEIGGFRPSESPKASWFGRVHFARAGETWPMANGKPMIGLCQLNVTELPFRPPRLEDIAFLTVFMPADDLPNRDDNGTNWCLRTYPTLDELVELPAPKTRSGVKAFPMRPKIVEADYPCRDDVPIEIPENIEETYDEMFPNTSGFKLGGWPTLIQSSVEWPSGFLDAISPEYVLQIDSTEKGCWMWGDSGVGYFGRGTNPKYENEWACEWQCY